MRPTETPVLDELKVYTKRETQKLIGLSGRTWDRLEARGETPPKTRLSLNRIGYRAGRRRRLSKPSPGPEWPLAR